MNTFIISSNWQKSGIKDPAKMISRLFRDFPLSYHRVFIMEIIERAFSFRKSEHHKKDLLDQFKMLEGVIIAASLINLEGRKDLATIEAAHLNQPAHYTTQEELQLQWNDIPHILTSDEVLNPYSSLRYFFKKHDLKTWQIILKKLFRYSKTKKCLFHDHFCINPIATSIYLVKLTEALHLIYVREIYPTANMLDNKPGPPETEQEKLMQV